MPRGARVSLTNVIFLHRDAAKIKLGLQILELEICTTTKSSAFQTHSHDTELCCQTFFVGLYQGDQQAKGGRGGHYDTATQTTVSGGAQQQAAFNGGGHGRLQRPESYLQAGRQTNHREQGKHRRETHQAPFDIRGRERLVAVGRRKHDGRLWHGSGAPGRRHERRDHAARLGI
ncbi:hypothetical protein KL932_002391 [Ogataea haglerorum]|nr:hypothetical protein KL950_003263 [Ogataea haglerorum]KAG7709337.1 hypothetical protein KL914_001727 [Ogataea haglerorum]KAG7742249.1 hypothetical protein KL932_002391 [Ogataea haglerorum]KAG7808019.1 hypothetical protein KL924_003702 [Ogataea haglerorum]